jgi:Fe-S-cluster containining protein
MIVQLRQAYASRDGAPSIERVDDTIFQRTYFTDCMGCGFCHDACCSYGAEIDIKNVQRLLAIADQLESYVGQQRTLWFMDQGVDDPETPGGRYTRTRVVEGACVFLSRQGRGCLLHAFCLTAGHNVHTLKPIVCSLFPVTFDNGLLRPAYEVQENSLVCLNTGRTLYHGARASLHYYFGEACIRELDAIALQTRQ